MTSDAIHRVQIDQLLAEFRQGYAPFVMVVLKTSHGAEWYSVLRNTPEVRLPMDSQQAQLDATALVRVILAHWDSTFSRVLTPTERSLLFELRTIRNRWAHQSLLSADDVDRLADSIARLLTAIRASNVDAVIALRDQMRRQRYQAIPHLSVQTPLKSPILLRIVGVSLCITILVIGLYVWERNVSVVVARYPTALTATATVYSKGAFELRTPNQLTVSTLPATSANLPSTVAPQIAASAVIPNGTQTITAITKIIPVTAAMTATPLPSFPCQAGQIKANSKTMIYHLPTGAFYAMTRNSAVVCFDAPIDAEKAGYRLSKR